MPIVFAGACSHIPGITAWSEAAPPAQREKIYAAFDELRAGLAASRPDTILLLTSEHWANFFEHVGAFCIGRADAFIGPLEPWLKVEQQKVPGNPVLSEAILAHCYEAGFELNFSHEMKLDHGSMVPLHLLNKDLRASVVPLVFNTLAAPRPTPARCVALGRALRPLLDQRTERIAVIATGGLSHDPGEKGHGHIDTGFDHEFIRRLTHADVDALASYKDGEMIAAGAGTPELLAWLCLAGMMAQKPARLIAYEPIVPWATGVGLVSYDLAA